MPVLEIRELTGKRRHLILSGLAAPLTGGSLGGSRQRGEIVRYAGSRYGVARQMGPEPLDTDWEFDFSRDCLAGGDSASLIVDGAPGTGITDPEDMRRLMAALCDDGNLLEFTFGEYVNTGLIREQSPSGGREGRLSIAITIEWIAPESPESRAVRPPNPDATASSLQEMWGSTMATVRRPLTMARSKIDAARDAVGQVNRAVRRTGSIVAEVRGGIRSIDALSSGLATALATVVDSVNVLRDAVDSPAGTLAQSDDAKAMVEALDFRGKTQRRCAAMRRRATLDGASHKVQSDPNVIGTHQGRQGEDLRHVAVIWYGPDQGDRWQHIARFNRLSSSLLEAGQHVLIPFPSRGL